MVIDRVAHDHGRQVARLRRKSALSGFGRRAFNWRQLALVDDAAPPDARPDRRDRRAGPIQTPVRPRGLVYFEGRSASHVLGGPAPSACSASYGWY
jgi:hypothetical protein